VGRWFAFEHRRRSCRQAVPVLHSAVSRIPSRRRAELRCRCADQDCIQARTARRTGAERASGSRTAHQIQPAPKRRLWHSIDGVNRCRATAPKATAHRRRLGHGRPRGGARSKPYLHAEHSRATNGTTPIQPIHTVALADTSPSISSQRDFSIETAVPHPYLATLRTGENTSVRQQRSIQFKVAQQATFFQPLELRFSAHV
jgi:hypothetical protein